MFKSGDLVRRRDRKPLDGDGNALGTVTFGGIWYTSLRTSTGRGSISNHTDELELIPLAEPFRRYPHDSVAREVAAIFDEVDPTVSPTRRLASKEYPSASAYIPMETFKMRPYFPATNFNPKAYSVIEDGQVMVNDNGESEMTLDDARAFAKNLAKEAVDDPYGRDDVEFLIVKVLYEVEAETTVETKIKAYTPDA